MDDRKRQEQVKGIFIDVLIIIVILGCIIGVILTIFSKVDTGNVKNASVFHIGYVIDEISSTAGATINQGDSVWLDDGTELGAVQTATLTEAQVILDNGNGDYVTVAYPDSNVRSLVGVINVTGNLSTNQTLLLDGTVEILPGQVLNAHTKYADFTIRITSVELSSANS